jgi:hypothetical protein
MYRYEDDPEDTNILSKTVVELDVLASRGQRYGMMWCEHARWHIQRRQELRGHRVVSAQARLARVPLLELASINFYPSTAYNSTIALIIHHTAPHPHFGSSQAIQATSFLHLANDTLKMTTSSRDTAAASAGSTIRRELQTHLTTTRVNLD